jgi:hemin uptake protein HemP
MHNDSTDPAPARSPVADVPDPGAPRRVSSQDILHGAREIVIEHDGRVYRLRITQNGKLILTA